VSERTRHAWDRIWRDSDIAAEHATGHYRRARAIRARYLPLLPDDGWVLEAGCGVGTELVALTERGRQVLGVDASLPALGKLHSFDYAVALAGADVHSLPLRDASVAAYLSFGVLEHFERGPLPALREAYRVLQPGGVLVLTVPAPNLVWRAVRFRRRLLRTPARASYYETALSRAQICDAVSSTGFAQINAVPVGHSFTLWGLGGPFRGHGHYETTRLARAMGRLLALVSPQAMAFAIMVTAKKR